MRGRQAEVLRQVRRAALGARRRFAAANKVFKFMSATTAGIFVDRHIKYSHKKSGKNHHEVTEDTEKKSKISIETVREFNGRFYQYFFMCLAATRRGARQYQAPPFF